MLVVFSSCENDSEYLFDETPTERVLEANAELTALLTNSEFGWKTTIMMQDYYSAGDMLLFKFDQNEDNSNGNVTIANPFDTATSEFKVYHEVSTLLNFNTQNDVFFWLATPSDNMPQGLGVEPEYIFEKEEDGKLYFTSKVQGNEMVLEKADEQDWDMSGIQENIENFRSNFESNYTAIRVTEGIQGASEENPFYLMFTDATFIEFFMPEKAGIFYATKYYEDGNRVWTNEAAFVYDHEAIWLSNPLVIAGDTLNKLVYSSELDVWEVGNEGIVGQLVSSVLPLESIPGFFDSFVDDICTTSDGWFTWPWNTTGELNEHYSAFSYNYDEPRLQYCHVYTDYVSPDGEELGEGLVLGNYDRTEFAFIPIDIVKLGENKFKLVRVDGDVVSNLEGAAERIATDADIIAFFDIMFSDKGWVVDAEFHSLFGLYDNTFYSLEDPANTAHSYTYI